MLKSLPNAKTSRIFFITNMVKPGAPEIPLGYLVEAIWPNKARWLGLIGRTQLTAAEMAAVNLMTWPELAKPFGLLDEIFNSGWLGERGAAAAAAQGLWPRSPLIIHTRDSRELLADTRIETNAGWTATISKLAAELSALGGRLTPKLLADGLPTHPQDIVRSPRASMRIPGGERRMLVEFADAA